jgi:DNA-binding GntR family transcriptional regulator
LTKNSNRKKWIFSVPNDVSQDKKKRARGADAVVDTLREDILTLALQPGTAIDEVALAARFGLSRTPIREALLILARDGLVSFLQNRTSIVTPHSMHNANDYLDTLSLLSRAVFRQSAERRNNDDLAALGQHITAFEAALTTGDVDKVEPAELAIKQAICQSTHNFFYQRYYPSCLDSGRRMLRLHYYPVATLADLDANLTAYRQLETNISAQDAEGCDRIARNMIGDTVAVLQRSLLPSDAANMDLDPQQDVRLQGVDR